MRRQVSFAAAMAGLLIGSAVGCAPEATRDAPQASGAGQRGDVERDGVTDEDLERLMALGYVDFVESEAAVPAGARVLDRGRVAPGLTLFSIARGCAARLIDVDGTLVHRWELPDCLRWDNTVLLPDGRLLVAGARRPEGPGGEPGPRFAAELGWDGSPRWTADVDAHHDADLLPDGRIAVLVWRRVLEPRVHPDRAVQDNGIALLDAEGRLQDELWLLEVLLDSPAWSPGDLDLRGRRTRDLLHANSVEWMRPGPLSGRHPVYDEDHVLLVLRNLDSVVVIDWRERRVVWRWGPGELSRPHDATLLPNGHVLIFDNGVESGASRVVEVDPVDGRIVWQYRAADPASFFTRTRGAAQRLENGNTLVTSSNQGWIFEVTREGELVWEYRVPAVGEEGRRPALARARRVQRAASDVRRRFRRSD